MRKAQLVPRNSQGKTLPGLSDNPRLSTLQNQVWYMYAIQRFTMQKIADNLGYSQQYISDIIQAVRKLLPEATKDEIVQERAELVRAKTQELQELASSPYASAIVRIAASRELRNWLDYEMRLLGLESPKRIDLRGAVGTTTYTIEAGSHQEHLT